MSKKILVTGGAGYVGSVLVPLLLFSGYKVRVLDNFMFGVKGLLGCFNNDNFELMKGDVRWVDEVLKALDGVDFIIHLAALVGYPLCKQDPEKSMLINAGGTKVVAEASGDIPMVLASTGSCYGNLEGVCNEKSSLKPLTVYGESKALAESNLKKRKNTIIYRFATGYGISPRMRMDLMINDFVYKAIREKNLVVYERYFQRTFIHVIDMARAFCHAIENFADMRDEIYNVGSEGMNLSKEYIAEFIKKKTDYYLHYADFGKDEDARDYEVSYDKINGVGYSTAISLERGINQLINLFKVFEIKHEYSNV